MLVPMYEDEEELDEEEDDVLFSIIPEVDEDEEIENEMEDLDDEELDFDF